MFLVCFPPVPLEILNYSESLEPGMTIIFATPIHETSRLPCVDVHFVAPIPSAEGIIHLASLVDAL
jgi:hypothetical protein